MTRDEQVLLLLMQLSAGSRLGYVFKSNIFTDLQVIYLTLYCSVY
jgi:hypothetical protein